MIIFRTMLFNLLAIPDYCLPSLSVVDETTMMTSIVFG